MDNSGNRFVWYELAAADVEGAKAFYSAVLGWRTADVSMPDAPYTLFIAKDTPVAGVIGLPPDALENGAEQQWIGYVAVDSVDDTANRVEQLGGVVHIPPADVLGVSRFSIVADPQRGTIALVNDREDSQQQPAPRGPGAVGWHELHTASIERSFAFYGPLLGWQKAGAPADPEDTYQEFSAGGKTIGGMLARPGQSAVFAVALLLQRRRRRGGGQARRGGRRPDSRRPVYCAGRRSGHPLQGSSRRHLCASRQACPHEHRVLFAKRLSGPAGWRAAPVGLETAGRAFDRAPPMLSQSRTAGSGQARTGRPGLQHGIRSRSSFRTGRY